jgi:hypothetical protein
MAFGGQVLSLGMMVLQGRASEALLEGRGREEGEAGQGEVLRAGREGDLRKNEVRGRWNGNWKLEGTGNWKLEIGAR